MITLPQRIEELRTEKGLSRPALASALGLPRTALEKFETGRQTPTKEQQEKLAAFFGVAYEQDEPGFTPIPAKKAKPAAPSAQEQGSMADAFLHNKAFQELVRTTVLEVLRSPEGQELLTRTVQKELNRQR